MKKEIQQIAEKYLKSKMPHLFINDELINRDNLPTEAKLILECFIAGNDYSKSEIKIFIDSIREETSEIKFYVTKMNDVVNHLTFALEVSLKKFDEGSSTYGIIKNALDKYKEASEEISKRESEISKSKDKDCKKHITKNGVDGLGDSTSLCGEVNESDIVFDDFSKFSEVNCPNCREKFNKIFDDGLIISFDDILPKMNIVNNQSEIKMIIDFLNNELIENNKNTNEDEDKEDEEDLKLRLLQEENKRLITSIKCGNSIIYQVTEQTMTTTKIGNKSIATFVRFIILDEGNLSFIGDIVELFSEYKYNSIQSEIINLKKLLQLSLDEEDYLEAAKLNNRIKELKKQKK